MTNEQAQYWLMYVKYKTDNNDSVNEAIDMAIEALTHFNSTSNAIKNELNELSCSEKPNRSEPSITICGIPYSIVLEKDNFDVDLHFGQVDYKTCTIRINEDIAEELQFEALCHEILHAILVHIGRNEMSQDEEFVQSLANAINQSFVPKIKGDKTNDE